MAKKGTTLSELERRFVEAFVGPCCGNATQATISAGYTTNRKAASVQAARLLGRARVQGALKARIERREERGLMKAAERDGIVAEIARNPAGDTFARLRAIDILNKCDARYALKLIHSGRLTIEDALEAANAKMAARQVKPAKQIAGK